MRVIYISDDRWDNEYVVALTPLGVGAFYHNAVTWDP